MPYVILGLVVIVVIYFATKSFSKSVDKNTLVGLYLAAGVILFVIGTLMALGGRLAFAVPAFVLGLLAVSKFLQERRLFLWRSGALADQKVDQPKSQKSLKKSDALLFLGLQEGATRADVRGAYKKCFLALEGDLEKNKGKITKLRQARDFLLKDK
ncbi:MAG: hypothetical protein V3R64_01670 [Sphingomonadales bacterium]